MTTQTQKDRRAFADYWGVDLGDVYWCEDHGKWTWFDEEEQIAQCGCYQTTHTQGGSKAATRPTAWIGPLWITLWITSLRIRYKISQIIGVSCR